MKKAEPDQHLESSGASSSQPGDSPETGSVHASVPRVPLVDTSCSSSPPRSSSCPEAASLDLQSSADSTSKEASGSSRSTLGWVALQHFKYHKSSSCPTDAQGSPQHCEPTTHPNDDLQDSAPPPGGQTSHCEPSADDLPPSPVQPSAAVRPVTSQGQEPPHYSSTANMLVFTAHFLVIFFQELIPSRRPEQRCSSPHAAEAGRTLELPKPKAKLLMTLTFYPQSMTLSLLNQTLHRKRR